MCRLFGLSAAPARVRATFWLIDAPDSLSQQSRREPDGTGLGWFDEHGDPCVDKQPLAAYEDMEFARAAREHRSATFIAHVRYASTGGLADRNTHPFSQDGRLFAHNGVIEEIEAFDERLGDERSLVAGDTDSERFFALITKETREHDGDLAAGIAAAARWVADTLPVFAINFVLVTPQELWALRYPDTHELYLVEREADGDPVEHSSSRIHARSHALKDTPSVVVATEKMDDHPGWTLLEPGVLLRAGADLAVTRTRILDGPPRHQLTLADLGHAAASQGG